MGSASDWEVMAAAAETLEAFGIPYEKRVVSAHRTPDLLVEYAKTARGRGIEVIIANGKRDDVLTDLVLRPGSRVCTRFAPREGNVSSVKKWVAHSTGFTKGKVYLNAKAVEAVCGDRAVSILPVGVTHVEGDFEKGDLVRIMSPEGQNLGVGRAAYSCEEAARVIGQHDCKPLVHYDYLYLE